MKKSQVGISRERELITFSNYFKNWINIYKRNRYSASTIHKYDDMLKFVQKYFGNTKLKDITKIDYQKMIDEFSKNHVKTTVGMLNGAIRSSLQDALEEQIIHFDFTRNALISSKKKSKQIKYFEIDEAYRIRQYCLHHANMHCISRYSIALSLATGLRYGEVLGLTWKDINFEKNTISVNKTYDYKRRTGFKPTKTPSSVRILDVDPVTMKLMKHLKLEQAQLFLKQRFSNNENMVFINDQHNIPGNVAVNDVIKRIQRDLGIKKGNLLYVTHTPPS